MSDVTDFNKFVKIFNPTDAQCNITLRQYGVALNLPPQSESKPVAASILPHLTHYLTAFKLEVREVTETSVSAETQKPQTEATEHQVGSESSEGTASDDSDQSKSDIVQTPAEDTSTETQTGESQSSDQDEVGSVKVYEADELNALYKNDVVKIAEDLQLSTEGTKSEVITRILESQATA